MVTSHKMNESEMGYRGSKSEFIIQNPQPIIINFVKEQRVDGGYCNNNNKMQLRCTLTGFERNYHIKIPSKQLNQRTFSTFLIGCELALPAAEHRIKIEYIKVFNLFNCMINLRAEHKLDDKRNH